MDIKVTVVIPAYNAEKTIGSCMESLKNQTLESGFYEIIIVDDGSTDQTASIVEKSGVRLIRTQNHGAAAARNVGAKAASAPLLVFTDSDCQATPEFLIHMIEPFQDPLVAGVKGAYLTEQSGLTARFVQTEYEFKYRRMSRFESIDFIDTYAAAFRRDIFLQLGGFDTSYPGASVEDQEFSFRMQKAGHRMLFIPEARVHHLHSTSPWIYLRKKFKIGYWKVRVVKEHPGKLIKDTHTPQILKLQITAVFLFLLGLALFPFYTWIFPVLFAVVFAASAVPEIFFIARNSPPSITISAPFFLLLRSVGLGSGILAGILGTTLKTKSGLDQ